MTCWGYRIEWWQIMWYCCDYTTYGNKIVIISEHNKGLLLHLNALAREKLGWGSRP